MGRPKGSTWFADSKIINALFCKPRKFSEFEWALVEEFGRNLPDDIKETNPEYWRHFVRSWRIPRKTLARRLKEFVDKGWVIRKVLPEHGHHVEYSLNFSRAEEMLKEMPVPEPGLTKLPEEGVLSSSKLMEIYEEPFIPGVKLTKSQKRILRKIDAIVPLKQELPNLGNLPIEKVLDIFKRLRSGEYVCLNCLKKGEIDEAMDVLNDADGRFYCRSCGQEIEPKECDDLLKEIQKKAFERDLYAAFTKIIRFLDSIDQSKK